MYGIFTPGDFWNVGKYSIYLYIYIYTHTGWWYTYPSEKYEFVSWDDYSSQLNGKS